MANNWRTGVFFAGLAFCVSFVSGLIGGVGFAVIILRAFLGALVFGALGAGADILLRRVFPELFAPEGENGVDITVPGINPHEDSGGEEFADGAEDSNDLQTASGEPYTGPDEAGDLVEEIEELPHSEADTAEVSAAFGAHGGGEAQSSEAGEAPEDLDVLPDMGEFDASFAGSGEEESPEVLAKTGSRGNAKAAVITENNNPALIAKALQTVLKRDSEG
jgi:hypothetical protein